MKIQHIFTKGNKTFVNEIDCFISEGIVHSFSFDFPLEKIETLMKTGKELNIYSFRKEMIPSIRKRVLQQRKKLYGIK